LLLLVMRTPFHGAKGDAPASAVLKDGDSYAIGIKMFSEYLLQFEIVGVFLLGAVIGAIVLAKTPTAADVDHEA
jgi:NADH-quinone oxidoreductase subunit J